MPVGTVIEQRFRFTPLQRSHFIENHGYEVCRILVEEFVASSVPDGMLAAVEGNLIGALLDIGKWPDEYLVAVVAFV